MNYAAQIDLEIAAGGRDRLTELSDLDGNAQTNSVVLQRTRDEVDRWIDSFCQKQHTVPFSTVPLMIREISKYEVIFRLKVNRRMVTEEDTRLHEERLALLREIRDGLVNPVENDPYPIGDGGGTPVAEERTVDGGEPFARDGWQGMGF